MYLEFAQYYLVYFFYIQVLLNFDIDFTSVTLMKIFVNVFISKRFFDF